jgi:hypothetical protein
MPSDNPRQSRIAFAQKLNLQENEFRHSEWNLANASSSSILVPMAYSIGIRQYHFGRSDAPFGTILPINTMKKPGK